MESKVLEPTETVFIVEPCLSKASTTDGNTNTSLITKVKSEDFEKRVSACGNEGGLGFSTAQIKVEYVANEDDYENRMSVITSRNVQNAESEDESGLLVPKIEILTNEKEFFDHSVSVTSNEAQNKTVKSEGFEKRLSACESEGGLTFSTAQIKIENVANEDDYENRMSVLTSRNVQNAESEDESSLLVPKIEILTNEKQFFDHSVSVTSNEAQNNKPVKTEDFNRSMSPCENDGSQGFSTEQIKVEYVASEEDNENRMSLLKSRNDQNAENGDKSGSLLLEFEINADQFFENSVSVTSDEAQNFDSDEESSAKKCLFCNRGDYLTLAKKRVKLELGTKSVLEVTLKPYRHSFKYTKFERKLNKLGSMYNYHKICYGQYLNKLISDTVRKNKTDIPNKKRVDEKCTKFIFEFVTKNIIQKQNCYYLKTLNKRYSQFIIKKMQEIFGVGCSAGRVGNKLLKKLLNNFPNEIKVEIVKDQKVIMPKNLNIDNVRKIKLI